MDNNKLNQANALRHELGILKGDITRIKRMMIVELKIKAENGKDYSLRLEQDHCSLEYIIEEPETEKIMDSVKRQILEKLEAELKEMQEQFDKL